jgi:oligopeptide/dipeptide ABC transporter ATP-binding protein
VSAVAQDLAALELSEVSVEFATAGGPVSAVSNVSLTIPRGEIFGLVGESGCGKTTLSLAALGLLPDSATVSGAIRVTGRDLVGLDEERLRELRGNAVSMIVQDPLTSLDPTYSIGAQLVEAMRVHRPIGRREARRRAAELLTRVGIADAERRLKDPPHRFSGGMRQRAVIAMAIANEPQLIIADEPTTALDVTIQAQILKLLRRLRDELGTSILVITHDLGVVAQLCDRVGVMYAGSLVELATTAQLFRAPRHPYTRALLAALPSREHRRGALSVIPGEVPDLQHPPAGCRFAPRCPHRMDACETRPQLRVAAPGSSVACWWDEQRQAAATDEPLVECADG